MKSCSTANSRSVLYVTRYGNNPLVMGEMNYRKRKLTALFDHGQPVIDSDAILYVVQLL
ncbi:Uncharacterised protein [Escherichia coli]|nr:hypothetical protein A151_04270 [Escherichia coli KTE195]EQP65587.1 hypothetical protein G741_03863 [Escherichia coli HVH 78 (4-2735946)]EQV22709.1 hypothetical protein G876_04092 [Escherichia coli HVH 227 (4-2277670)]ESP17724.1 hypothetical protein G748_04042 [Escherichia coli HVH 86 (4-7026218)]STN06331.1 Uncharacterised protein [Escherichia coli]